MKRLVIVPVLLALVLGGSACSQQETASPSTADIRTSAVEGRGTAPQSLRGVWGENVSASNVNPSEAPVSSSTSDPEQAPTQTLENAHEVTGEASGRLRIGSVLDVPLNSMSPSASIVNPPNGTDAFVIAGEGYGVAGNDEGLTTFLVMHSGSYRSGAVGNNLIDRDRGVSTVSVGDEVVLDGLAYTVSRVEVEVKAELRDEAWVWENKQGRVVILTCLQRPAGEGRSVQNVVIEATR